MARRVGTQLPRETQQRWTRRAATAAMSGVREQGDRTPKTQDEGRLNGAETLSGGSLCGYRSAYRRKTCALRELAGRAADAVSNRYLVEYHVRSSLRGHGAPFTFHSGEAEI